MEKAKQAVRNFVPHGDKHRTTIDQEVRAPITQETVRPHQHEEVVTAVDKEIHQDHHHTVVQPIAHKETLPEQHSHNLAAVEHKTFNHGNEEHLRDHLERDAAKYRDESVTHKTTHTSTAAPVVAGERTYHHVHEHIQPVIQKEVIAPHVVHTTVPIHETHHAQALHHGTSTLPVKTLEEFTRGGGKLEAIGTHHVKEFDGCPESYNPGMQQEKLGGDRAGMHLGGAGAGAGAAAVGVAAAEHHHHKHDNDRAGHLGSTERSTGPLGENRGTLDPRAENRGLGGENRGTLDPRAERSTGHSHTAQTAAAAAAGTAAAGAMGSSHDHKHGHHHQENLGATGNSSLNNPNVRSDESKAIFNSQGTRDSGISMASDKHALSNANPSTTRHAHDSYGEKGLGTTTSNTSTGSTAKKPSLLDRLNPMKDTDGDGKKGLMD